MTNAIPLIKTHKPHLRIVVFWIMTVFLFLLWIYSIVKESDELIVSVSTVLFFFIFYAVLVRKIRISRFYEDKITVYSPYHLTNREIEIKIKEIEQVIFIDRVKDEKAIKYILKNNRVIITTINSRFFQTKELFIELINYFKNRNLTIQQKQRGEMVDFKID